MKVFELIDALKKLPQNKDVMLHDKVYDDEYEATEVLDWNDGVLIQ